LKTTLTNVRKKLELNVKSITITEKHIYKLSTTKNKQQKHKKIKSNKYPLYLYLYYSR